MATSQVGEMLAAVGTASPAVIVALCVFGFLLAAVLCWTVANSNRTENLALIIKAMRPTAKEVQDEDRQDEDRQDEDRPES